MQPDVATVSRPVSGVLFGGFLRVAPQVATLVTIHLCGPPGDVAGQASPSRPCSRWGLPSRPGRPGRWCALTAPFHPYLCPTSHRCDGGAIGGLFSVALSSDRSPRPGSHQHRALWSPDFPQTPPTSRRRHWSGPRSPGRLTVRSRAYRSGGRRGVSGWSGVSWWRADRPTPRRGARHAAAAWRRATSRRARPGRRTAATGTRGGSWSRRRP